MAEQMSLDSILDEKTPEAPAPEAPPPPETKDPVADQQAERNEEHRSRKSLAQEKEFNAQGLTRDPATGQFSKKQPEAEPQAQKPDAGTPIPAAAPPAPAAPAAAAPAQEQFTEREKAFLRAAQEERAKRQELERKFSAAPAEPAKTFWDDPEAALAKQREEIAGVVTQTRLSTSEIIARSRYMDFDEKVAAFGKLAEANPFLAQQCTQASDPAEYAYRLGKNHMELQQVGGMDAMRQKIEAETRTKVRAEIEAELKTKADAFEKARAALPGSLSDSRGTPQQSNVWGGPPTLDNILKG